MNKKNNFLQKADSRLITIVICFSLWWLIIPAIVGLFLLRSYRKELQKLNPSASNKKDNTSRYNIYDDDRLQDLINKIVESEAKLKKQSEKIEKIAVLYKSIKSYVDAFGSTEFSANEIKKIEKMIQEIEVEDLMNPTVEIKLHNADIKDLRKQYRDINKQIDFVLTDYEKRYTTKANLAIYRLMVVALRSELQNVLYTMKFGKLQDAENAISEITDKYIKIATDGNQTIASTITRFVVQTKSLFLDAAKVEYEYYLRQQRIKEEQKALREQMRQEAEERRRLEAEQKKIEAEESKYENEMEKIQEQLKLATDEKADLLSKRIEELEAMLAKVGEKKEEIAKLQNGKAGYVYVISNLGSFGETVFKIGMTRRQIPEERIYELGDASVPFSFDIHSLIFSEDAPALETAIHHKLNDKRVNKVNLRKEFFNVTLDELEALVYELEPSAEFNRTMAAEQYRQSLSMGSVFEMTEEDNDINDIDDIAE